MKVKKFTATTMPEAMKKIRSELGKDAVILNSKVVNKGGVLGFFMKKNIEVIAAVDSAPAKQAPVDRKDKVLKQESLQYRQQESDDRPQIPKRNQQPDTYEATNSVKEEIQHLKKLLADMAPDLASTEQSFPGPLQNIHQSFIDQEIDKKTIKELMMHLYERWVLNEKQADPGLLEKWVLEYFHQQLESVPFGEITYDKQFINVIGPTGVGKTTTLAKLAARSVLNDRKEVAFITTDTYRIAAIEQLKTYAAILGIPVEVAYDIEDFKRAKEKFKQKDLVLIDTAGRNYRNSEYVGELKNILDFNRETETFLVLPLTSKLRDMKAIYEQFNMLGIDKFIFTKADETVSFGALLSMVMEYGTGVAYITHGQNVPDDIRPGSIETIVGNLLGDE